MALSGGERPAYRRSLVGDHRYLHGGGPLRLMRNENGSLEGQSRIGDGELARHRRRDRRAVRARRREGRAPRQGCRGAVGGAGRHHAGRRRTIDVTADVTKFTDIEPMRRRIEGALGPVDLLVANAGGSFTTPGPLEQTHEEEWRASIDGNLPRPSSRSKASCRA